jgi:hypothetical protein
LCVHWPRFFALTSRGCSGSERNPLPGALTVLRPAGAPSLPGVRGGAGPRSEADYPNPNQHCRSRRTAMSIGLEGPQAHAGRKGQSSGDLPMSIWNSPGSVGSVSGVKVVR